MDAFWITEAQFNSLLRTFLHNQDGSPNWISFRRRCRQGVGLDGAIMIHWCGMWLGIEPDGYAHSESDSISGNRKRREKETMSVLDEVIKALQAVVAPELKAMNEKLEAFQRENTLRFEAVAKSFDALESQTKLRFDALENQMELRFDGLNGRFDEVLQRLALDRRIAALEQERDERKEADERGEDQVKTIVYRADYGRIAGSLTAGVMLCHLQALSRRARRDSQGARWIYYDIADWEAATFMGKHEQYTARRRLEAAGFIETRHQGYPQRVQWRVKFDTVHAALRELRNG